MTDGKLHQQCLDLDRSLAALAALEQQIEQQQAQITTELQRRRADRFVFGQRAAVLDRPQRESVDYADFIDAGLNLGIREEALDACVARSVSILKARKLLGEEALAPIVTTTPGKLRLRIVSAARAGSAPTKTTKRQSRARQEAVSS